MNLCEEAVNLSRHLMLFLIAVFAFVAEPLVNASSSDRLLLAGFASSLVVGLLSFLAGYSTHFQVFNDQKDYPPQTRDVPTSAAIRKLKLQYALTIISLVLVIATLLWRLF
jgi:hypothetical protein